MQIHIFLTGALSFALFFSISTGCDDIDSQLCADIGGKYPGLCNDTCLSNMCQRTCGLCPIKCYECHEIDNPKNCSTVVECPTMDHNCFTTQSFADNFNEIYKLGCATKTLCKDYFGDGGRRGLSVDATCCPYDNCNNLTPEEIEYEKSQHQNTVSGNGAGVTPLNLIDNCRNIDDGICSRLAAIKPGFCHNDTCVASKLCPRMCGQCFNCYSCNDIDNISDCNTTTTCSGGKNCFSLETLSIDFRPVYRVGCMDTTLCQRFEANPSHIFGKRQNLQLKGGCCHSDLCNDNVVMTTTPLPTTPAPTTSCPYHFTGSCPTGSERYLNSCYYIGTKTMTHTQAKDYCRSKCAKLVDFDSMIALRNTLSHLHIAHIHGHQLFGDLFWTDAEYSGSSWIWSTTHSKVNSELSRYLDSTHTNSKACALAGELRFSRALLAISCDAKYKPMCDTL